MNTRNYISVSSPELFLFYGGSDAQNCHIVVLSFVSTTLYNNNICVFVGGAFAFCLFEWASHKPSSDT